MVRLSDEAAKKYPTFEDYLRTDFLHVKNKPRVMKAFWKWSDFHDTPLTLGFFAYGWPPVIKLQNFQCHYQGEIPGDSEHSPHTHFAGIELGKTWDKSGINILDGLAALVVDVVNRAAQNRTKSDDSQILEVMEATIMHEMVHWSFFYNGVDESSQYKGDAEYGTHSFEREAYGHLVHIVGKHGAPFCFEQEVIEPPHVGVRTSEANAPCRILEIEPNSPADKAGLKANDQIVKFDGRTIVKTSDFDDQLFKKSPGDKVAVEVRRGDKTLTLNVTLAAPAD